MKKIFSSISLILVLFALATVTCKKDKSSEELLIGKWEIQTMYWVDYKNNVKTDEGTETFSADEMVLEFLSNKTGKEYEDGNLNDTFEWSINGDKITLTLTGEDPMDIDFSVNESTLTFSMTEIEVDGSDTYRYEMTYTAHKI
jgi:hypothetical protein